jgi:predicted DNA-binding transcriptional regulator AlpA
MERSMTEPISTELLAYSVSGFCKAVGISQRTFYGLRERGEAPPMARIGRRTVIRREAAEQWLRDRERAS